MVMKDRIILKRKIVKVILIGVTAFVIEEAVLLCLYLFYTFERNEGILYMMAFLATVVPCMVFLLFSEYLRINENTVSHYRVMKKKTELQLADVSMTVEFRSTNNRMGSSNNYTMKYIVLRDNKKQEILFSYDEKTYNLLNEYISFAKRYDQENLKI